MSTPEERHLRDELHRAADRIDAVPDLDEVARRRVVSDRRRARAVAGSIAAAIIAVTVFTTTSFRGNSEDSQQIRIATTVPTPESPSKDVSLTIGDVKVTLDNDPRGDENGASLPAPLRQAQPWCSTDKSTSVSIRKDGKIIESGWTIPRYRAIRDGLLFLTTMETGSAGVLAIVQAPRATTELIVRPPDGDAERTYRVEDGLSIIDVDPAHVGDRDSRHIISAYDIRGNEIATLRTRIQVPAEIGSPGTCDVLELLPAPGPVQPDDPDGAIAAIDQAAQNVLADVLNGPTDLGPRGRLEVDIRELVFESPDTAYFSWSVTLVDPTDDPFLGSTTTPSFGAAERHDGSWRITYPTFD